ADGGGFHLQPPRGGSSDTWGVRSRTPRIVGRRSDVRGSHGRRPYVAARSPAQRASGGTSASDGRGGPAGDPGGGGLASSSSAFGMRSVYFFPGSSVSPWNSSPTV